MGVHREKRSDLAHCGACGTKPFLTTEDEADDEYAQVECYCGVRGMAITREIDPGLSPERCTELAIETWNGMWRQPPGQATKQVVLEFCEVLRAIELRRPIVQISTGRVGSVPLETALAAIEECGFRINP